MNETKEIKLFDADSLDYAGKIVIKDEKWNFIDVTDDHLIKMTSAMPLNGVLSSLMTFNMVYELEHVRNDT